MKVKVRYKQKIETFGVYVFYRIIELTPQNKFFKKKIKNQVCSTLYLSKADYCNTVKRILSLSKEEIADWIKPDVENYLTNPSSLNSEINDFKIEIEI